MVCEVPALVERPCYFHICWRQGGIPKYFFVLTNSLPNEIMFGDEMMSGMPKLMIALATSMTSVEKMMSKMPKMMDALANPMIFGDKMIYQLPNCVQCPS